jgi:hypothetical protein
VAALRRLTATTRGRLAAGAAILVLAGAAALALRDDQPADRPAARGAPVVLATGLAEGNAQLLAEEPDPAFAPWRDRVVALRPTYVRVLVDWARLQPAPDAPPALELPADGCLRGLPPCAPFAGLRAQLEALAARQRADPGRWLGVLSVHGVPDWAARPAGGCERSDAAPRSRPITPAGLVAYRELLAALVGLARRTGARIVAWSPWNEPNHPAFLSPQRATCAAAAPSLAPAVYAELVRAARAALGPGRALLLGEQAGYDRDTPRSTAISSFVAALPEDVACASRRWSQHAYAELDPEPGEDPVGTLLRALDERPCTRGAHVWVTETGAGGADPGGDRPLDPEALQAGCAAQETLLRRWADDPRVDAAFQYTFREDTAYPVGLADAGLTRTYPTYELWRAWGGDRAPEDPPPPTAC